MGACDGEAMGETAGAMLGEALGEAAGAMLGEALGEAAGAMLGEALGEAAGAMLGEALGASCGGNGGEGLASVVPPPPVPVLSATHFEAPLELPLTAAPFQPSSQLHPSHATLCDA
jgi:phage tail tape-measure protein